MSGRQETQACESPCQFWNYTWHPVYKDYWWNQMSHMATGKIYILNDCGNLF